MGAGPKNDDPEIDSTNPRVAPSGATAVSRDGLSYTPLFRAQHEGRYRRQALIREYQDAYGCNLVVMIDQILSESVTYFAEVLQGLDNTRDLHLILCSPGGDGETAIRLARMAQAASKRF